MMQYLESVSDGGAGKPGQAVKVEKAETDDLPVALRRWCQWYRRPDLNRHACQGIGF
jgi:hypothetical protein